MCHMSIYENFLSVLDEENLSLPDFFSAKIHFTVLDYTVDCRFQLWNVEFFLDHIFHFLMFTMSLVMGLSHNPVFHFFWYDGHNIAAEIFAQ